MAIKAKAEITLSHMIDVIGNYRYYLLQSSTASAPSKPTTYPPSSAWDDTEPSYTSGSTNSLYVVDCSVYSNGTFYYSPVSLSTSYEAAKEAYNKAQNAQDAANNAQDTADSAQDAADDAKKYATNYMDFAGNYGVGLVIGDLTKSVLGRNIHIQSDRIDIRNDDENVLSTYQAERIQLGMSNGKNLVIDTEKMTIRNGSTNLASFGDNYISLGEESKNAVINLCNGAGDIRAYDYGGQEGLGIYSEALLLSSPWFNVESDKGGCKSIIQVLSEEYDGGYTTKLGTILLQTRNKSNDSVASVRITVNDDEQFVRLASSYYDESGAQVWNEVILSDKLYTNCAFATTGSILVGGKTVYNDGKTGMALASSGNLHLQHSTEPSVRFYTETETSDSGRISVDTEDFMKFTGAGVYVFDQHIRTSKGFYSAGKTSMSDGKAGCVIYDGVIDICGAGAGASITAPTIRFYQNGATSHNARVNVDSNDAMNFIGASGGYTFDYDVTIDGTAVKASLDKIMTYSGTKSTNSNGNIAVQLDATKYVILGATFVLSDGSTTNCSTYTNGGKVSIHVANNSGTSIASQSGTLRYVYYEL